MILTKCDSVPMKTKFCNFSRFNLVVLLLLCAATHATAFATRYVKGVASGLGDGSSWADASNPYGADNRLRTADDGLRLQVGSPSINAGIALTDLTTNILENAYWGNPDIGAYESNCILPTTYAVTGGGAYCAGGTGVTVGLANSETSVNYQLKIAGTAVGSVVAGMGSVLSFGAQSVAGTYTVDAIKVSDGCTATSTGITMMVVPPVTPAVSIAITAGRQTTCANMIVSFTATPTHGGTSPVYQWKRNGVDVGTNSDTYTTRTLTHGESVTCVMTSNAVGASPTTATSNSIVMTVIQYANGTITNGATATFCGTGLLTGSPSNAAAYQWKRNGADLPSATASTYNATASGNYTLAITVLPGSCSMITSATAVTILPLPTATITPASPTTFCQGGSVVLNANIGTGFTYQWKRNNTNLNNETQANYTATTSGDYAVAITDVAGNGCTNTAAMTVTVNALPTLTVTSPNNAICNGATETLTANPVGGGTYTYRWNDNSINARLSVTPNATATYSVTVTDANNCVTTNSKSLIVNALPTVTVTSPNNAICNGATETLTANPLGGGGTYTYRWNDNSTSAILSVVPNANATYSVTVTDANNCVTTNSKSLIVNAVPTVTITAPNNAICNGATETLTVNPVGGGGTYTYRWNDNSTNATLSVAPNANAAYSVTVTDVNNCVANSSKSLIVNVLPSFVLRNTTPILCNGGISQCTFGSNLGTPPFQYALNGLNYQTNNLLELGAGTQRIWVRDANHCIDSMGSVTLVQPALLTVSAPTAAALICYDGFTNLQSTATGGTTPYQYSINGFVYQSANTFSVQGGTYQMTVKDVNGCQTASSLYNLVRPADLAVTTVTNPINCWGETTQTTIQVANAVAPIQYVLNGAPQNNNPIYNGLGVGNYAVRVTDHRGCVKQASFTLTQPPLLAGSIEVDTLICKGKTTPIVVKTTGGTGAVQYRLNEGTFENSLPSVSSGTHTVQIRDANQCLKTLPSVKIEEGVAKTEGLRNLTIHCHDADMRIYPNPVADVMAVDFKISQQSTVKILVYNALGDLIAKKEYLTIDAGNYTTSWDTSNWAAQFVRVCLEVNGTCAQVTSIIIVH